MRLKSSAASLSRRAVLLSVLVRATASSPPHGEADGVRRMDHFREAIFTKGVPPAFHQRVGGGNELLDLLPKSWSVPLQVPLQGLIPGSDQHMDRVRQSLGRPLQHA